MCSTDMANLKFIRDLMPKYDGNPKTLNFFIREVENIILLLEPTARTNPALICLIKSRLSGTAIDAIAYEESLDTWQAIKTALIRRLGEPRDEIQVMQELTRIRRNKNEDAEAFGKRLRDILDTLQSVGKHSDKSYYEKMVIDQYVNNLEFHVSVGVRISNPATLEIAITNARQEEARLVHHKFSNNFNTPFMQAKLKETHKLNLPTSQPFASSATPPQQRFVNPNFQPQRNNWTPDQRQQLPWKNKTSGNVRPSGSGTFRNSSNYRQQPNVPHQQVNPPQKVSDVTMRSVNKPQRSQFEEVFYTSKEQEQYQDDYNPCYEQGEHYNYNPQYADFSDPFEDTPADESHPQDFYQGSEQEELS